MRTSRRWMLAGLGSLVAAGCWLAAGGQPSRAAPVSPAAAPGGSNDRLATINGYLNQHCIACHGPKKQKADLKLDGFSDQAAVLKGRKTFKNALKMIHAGEMPPEEKPQPKADETAAFFAAVEGLYADADRNARPDPGRVTVRRLNRTEYNNTIRDLLGVEFSPADDFPADDIGHGFDNIGDVLTVSPILMERYLSAAELVANQAIVLEPPKPTGRWQGGRFLEPAGPKVPEARFRPVPKGAVNTPFKLETDGEYVFRTGVYAKTVDDEKVKIALSVDGKEVETFEVKASSSKEPQTIRHKLTLEPGEHRFAVALVNPSEGAQELDIGTGGRRRRKDGDKPAEAPKPQTQPQTQPAAVRTLFVEYIALEGPADMRPASHRRLLKFADPSAPHAEQTRQILQVFASRAYRRPATKDEVDRLVALVEKTEAGGEKWEAGLQLAVQAVLTSPKFLFRLELDDRPDSPEPRPLDEFALASRLSYFLWATMPDDELRSLAEKKQLTANLEQQVKRMLLDPRAHTLIDNFAMQWLQLRRIRSFIPDPNQFPTFDERLRSAMLKETELFFEAIIKEDRSILDLIDADFTFLNERLAKHYGIGDTNGNWLYQKPDRKVGDRIPYDSFVRVSLPPGGARGGLLTQASVLTVTSNPTRTSPVKRGKWVLEQILGTPPPAPPANVPPLEADGKPINATSVRKRLEIHRENPACANCHAKMDPIGFAFENFNAIGAFRDKDGGQPIDAAGTLPDGKSFQGAAELKKILKDKKDLFARALTEQLMIYGLGRGLEYYDDRSIDQVSHAVAGDGYKFSTLIAEIVKSDPFRMRRGIGE